MEESFLVHVQALLSSQKYISCLQYRLNTLQSIYDSE